MKHTLALVFMTCMMVTVGCSSPKVEICRYNGDRQAAVSLTFDDGIIDDYTLIAPHLDRLGMKGTFWICPANIGIDDSYSPRLTWENCRRMSSSGHEISNHSWDHANLTSLTPEEIEAEAVKADDAIEANVGIRPKTFCFPYNAHNAVVDSICSKGRVGMRLFQEAQGQVNNHSTSESLDAWLDSVISEGEWGVTMTHGIHNGWDQWEDENVLWDFYGRLADRRDSVWVGTFAQVASYIAERDACTLSVSRRGHTVTLTPSCSLDPELFTEPLSARITWGKKSVVVDFNPFGGPQTFDLDDPLLGKSILVFGDSYVRNHVRPFTETWHYKVAQRHSMRYSNYGINGNCVGFDRVDEGFGEKMLTRYNYLPKDTDYIILIAGHNDAYYIAGSEENHEICRQAMDDLCRGLKERFPQAKIGWVTPWDVDRPGFAEIMEDIKSTCDGYGIPVLDAAHTSGILVRDEAFREKYFQSKGDTAHLNPAGHDLLLDWGDDFLKTL